jgi:hypothetical protein
MALEVDEVEVGPEPTSLDLLQAVYRNPDVPLPVRMRAAIAAAPYEHPRLSITANVEGKDIGLLLERAIERSLQAGTVINGVAREVPQGPPVRLPVPSPPGPGFRRRI